MPASVLHVSASFPRSATDAVAPFLADLADVQSAAGWQVAAVAAHDAGLPGVHRVGGAEVRRARYAPARWEVIVYRGGGHGRLRHPGHALLLPGLLLSLVIATAKEIRARRPDVVHAHWILPNGLAVALLPRRLRPRTVLTLHGTDVELASKSPMGRLARWVAHRMDVLLAVSGPLARRAEEVLGLPTGTVGVARLPLPPQIAPAPIPDGRPRLLAAGRASSEKGFDVLVAALRDPRTAGWDATFVTEGPERERLEADARDLSGRVTFAPLQPRAKLFDLVRAHHAVAVPSRTEGLGMFALEALALGRPVVASAVGGLTEVVADEVDGRLVPADDPGALAEAIATLRLAAPKGASVADHQARAVIDAHARAYGFSASDEVQAR